ncbi:MAG: hypothetical protein ACHQQQ_00060 [Bacteroidota bacterium]
MPNTKTPLSPNLNGTLSETSAAYDRFHQFVRLTQMDLLDLKKTFDDAEISIDRFNSSLGTVKDSASIRENTEQSLSKSEQTRQNRELDHVNKISSLLRFAFADSGDKFIESLLKAVQIVSRIVSMLKLSDSGESNSPILPSIGGIASLFSLFGEGVSAGNFAMNVAGGTRNRGTSINDLFGGFNASGLNFASSNLNPLLSEIRSLRNQNIRLIDAVQNLEIQAPIILEGTLSGQEFLRKEMPAFDSFNSKKKI